MMTQNQKNLESIALDDDLALPAERISLYDRIGVIAGDMLSLGKKVGGAALRAPVYLLAGHLPEEVQDSIHRRFSWYHPGSATRLSNLVTAPLYGAAVYELGRYSLLAETPFVVGTLSLVGTGFLALYGIYELATRTGKSEHGQASLPGWLLWQPVRVADGALGKVRDYLHGVDARVLRERDRK